MKCILSVLAAATAVCLADGPPDTTPQTAQSEVRKVHREHRDSHGEVDAYTDTFYRGEERILIQATYTKPTKSGIKMWREFVVGRTTVTKEMDYADDKPRLILLYRDGALYEAFRRQADGSVEPMSSDELSKAKAEMQEFMAGFEAVMERVAERLQTNSVEKVVQDLKSEVEQAKQKQKQEGEKK